MNTINMRHLFLFLLLLAATVSYAQPYKDITSDVLYKGYKGRVKAAHERLYLTQDTSEGDYELTSTYYNKEGNIYLVVSKSFRKFEEVKPDAPMGDTVTFEYPHKKKHKGSIMTACYYISDEKYYSSYERFYTIIDKYTYAQKSTNPKKTHYGHGYSIYSFDKKKRLYHTLSYSINKENDTLLNEERWYRQDKKNLRSTAVNTTKKAMSIDSCFNATSNIAIYKSETLSREKKGNPLMIRHIYYVTGKEEEAYSYINRYTYEYY